MSNKKKERQELTVEVLWGKERVSLRRVKWTGRSTEIFAPQVTCALGGQALLGAQILVDYGFKNVKVMEGGCVAFKKDA